MIQKLADNIVSPLGFSTAENYGRVCRGESGVIPWTDPAGAHISLSRIDREMLFKAFTDTCKPKGAFTSPEQAMLLSAHLAVKEAGIDASAQETIFILSSTKGNIELLSCPDHGFEKDRIHLWYMANLLAAHFNNPNTPITVSNACISGACAQLSAYCLLQQPGIEHVLVTGVDMAPDFIVAGFQSFKSLDPERCRPFDARRIGLNIGEAAATIVYTKPKKNHSGMFLKGGCVRNDANHISGPSRTGEGLFRALTETLSTEDITFTTQEIAFICAHGTATPYNDQMEAIAFQRAGLDRVPVFSLKAHFGHTMGAAGLLESIVSMKALEEGTILPSLGYEQPGIDGDIYISTEKTKTDNRHCIKTLSGFGGGNAVLLFEKQV